MKKNLFIIFLLTPVLIHAQTKLFLGITGSPEVSTRDARGSFIFTYTAGITGCYFLSDRIWLSTGLLFSKKGYQLKDLRFYDSNGQMVSNAKLKDVFQYVEVPLFFNMRFGTSKLSPMISAGLIGSYVVKEKLMYRPEYFPNGTGNRKEIKKSDYCDLINAYANPAIFYQLSDKCFLTTGPFIRANINPLQKGGSLHIITTGWNVTVQVRIK